mgnify:CR=1 FL=1
MIHPVMFRSLWAYRGFVWSSVLREFNGKYRESLFGAFWSVASPLSMIIVYTVIFSQLMRATLPGQEQVPFAFSIYLCAGVITWGLFAEMLARLNNVFLEHGNLIKKSNFPRICLPAIVTLSALINFGIVFGLYLVFLAIIGHWPGWAVESLPITNSAAVPKSIRKSRTRVTKYSAISRRVRRTLLPRRRSATRS